MNEHLEEIVQVQEDSDRNVEDVHFKRDLLPARLDGEGLQFLGAGQSLMVACERLEQHCRRLAARHRQLESLLSRSVSWFGDGAA